MEDAADAVVPLRPGFDIQIRGFNRNQVIEHIEHLEDQLKLITLDRNEAVRLNGDLRKLCDETRSALDETERRLKTLEASDTGLPAASQRVHNMLANAEEEVQTLRSDAQRQAEIIRGTAENEARELITQAEENARQLRDECSSLIAEVEARRDLQRREHDQNLSELRTREQRLRQEVRNEYKRIIDAAQEEADAALGEARRRCGEWDAETERMRLEALEEIHAKHAQLEQLRHGVLATMENARSLLDNSADTLRYHDWQTLSTPVQVTATDSTAGSTTDGEDLAETAVNLPEQREIQQQDFSPALNDVAHRSNGSDSHDTGALQN
ncbi:hypothetical protein [Salinifilum ghardaiensis]